MGFLNVFETSPPFYSFFASFSELGPISLQHFPEASPEPSKLEDHRVMTGSEKNVQSTKTDLVGGLNPSEKYERQLG